MPTDRTEQRTVSTRGVPWVLVAWVGGCLLVAGFASALYLRAEPDQDPRGGGAAAPAAGAAADAGADAPVAEGTSPETGAIAPASTAPAATVHGAEVPEPPPWLEGDADGDGALADDLDADGDGILDDWEPPDAGIGTYKPGELAEDGEFEDDRRAAQGCLPNYPEVCVPPAPPVLTCEEAGGWNTLVQGGDPHGFDTDLDGIACEYRGEGEEPVPATLDPPPAPG